MRQQGLRRTPFRPPAVTEVTGGDGKNSGLEEMKAVKTAKAMEATQTNQLTDLLTDRHTD